MTTGCSRLSVSFVRLPAWLAALGFLLLPGLAGAGCIPVAGFPARAFHVGFLPAGGVPSGKVGVTYLGHSSFLIESTGGATIVTDYNGYNRPRFAPHVVTMNNAHSTHFTEALDPEIQHVLRGWDPAGKMAKHDMVHLDVRIHNVPTNVRDYGGTRYNGNSIFVYEVGGLCIAHVGHLHHVLTEMHLAELGKIDVLMVPVDGIYTMGQFDMLEVVQQIKAPLVIPMHYFDPGSLARFVNRLRDEHGHTIRIGDSTTVLLSRAGLPRRERPEVLVMPGF
ncbi:MAG: MBL fold metallo-hydrolase [Pseudomonadota bacterium]